jgi:hypothetical protein
MKWIAALLAALAVACMAGAAWLWVKTWRFATGADYALDSAHQPGYTARGVEADGSGIFAPAVLMLVVGLFLARFARNLWREEQRRRRADRERRTRRHGRS